MAIKNEYVLENEENWQEIIKDSDKLDNDIEARLVEILPLLDCNGVDVLADFREKLLKSDNPRESLVVLEAKIEELMTDVVTAIQERA